MSALKTKKEPEEHEEDFTEGRLRYEMDVDRMVNEGLGGGQVTMHNGWIGDTTVDDMDPDAANHAASKVKTDHQAEG